jgi:DNA-binding LacI/PurR family transcriptional regulator
MPTKKNRTRREKRGTVSPAAPPPAEARRKPRRRKFNRRSAERSESVMVALDNPNGIRWVLEFAPIYATILHGIEQGLTALNKQMQVCSIRSPEEFESLVKGRPPDGLLFLASKNVVSLAASIGSIPCLSVLGNPCDGFFDRVTYNNPATGHLPAEFFLKNGLTTAAILGPTEPGRHTTFGVRHSTFVETMEDARGTVISLLSGELYEPENPSNQPRPAEIARLVQALKNSRPLPKGLYVMADNLLPAVHAHLLAAGITPGTDLHVVSCNSESPYFAGLSPEPARVDIPAEEIGFRAVELLEWRSRNPARPTSTTVFTPSFHIPRDCPLRA